jgi:hypothetical protein
MAALQLLVVQGLKPAGDVGLEVTFHTKERAVLRSAQVDYERCERLLQQSRDRQRPVGVSVLEGEIQQVLRADRDVVRELAERGPARVDIWFFGHDGKFQFDRSNPHAKRIFDTLARSERSGRWVWFAATLPALLIVDVASEDELPRTK